MKPPSGGVSGEHGGSIKEALLPPIQDGMILELPDRYCKTAITKIFQWEIMNKLQKKKKEETESFSKETEDKKTTKCKF